MDSGDQRKLPLFPLNTVLFPGMLLPLHIFEERYRQMIGMCLETDRTFGVCLIQDGREVGDPAVPFAVGTLARIVEVERLDDGRMNLVCIGTERFRLIDVLEQRPYLVGQIRLIPPPAETVDLALAADVGDRFRAYVQDLRGPDAPPITLDVPDDPVRLAFQISAALNVSPSVRQSLLEIDSTAARLRELRRIIRREHDSMRVFGRNEPRANVGRFSRN